MTLSHTNTNKAQPLEAWAGVNPEEGVKTRRRSAKLGTTHSKNRSLSCEATEIMSTEDNKLRYAQPDMSQEREQSGVEISSLARGRKHPATLRISTAGQSSHVTVKRQSRSIERAVTTREQNILPVSTTCAPSYQSHGRTENTCSIFEAGEMQMESFVPSDQDPCNSGRPKHMLDLLQPECLEQRAVLEHGLPQNMQTSAAESDTCTNHNILLLDNQSSDSDSDSDTDENSSSDVTATQGQEAINQLMAVNEDLKSESKYYRLMAEITMKTAAIRRGCE